MVCVSVRIAVRMLFAVVYSVLHLLLDVLDVRLPMGNPEAGLLL